MNEKPVVTDMPDPLQGRYAGFWVRFAAAIIDLVVYSPFYFGIKKLCGTQNLLLGEAVAAVFALGVYAAFFSSKIQASPGMYLLRFHVANEHGERISFTRALVWGVVSAIGVMLCFVGVVYMQFSFDLNQIQQLLLSCAEENVRTEDCLREVETIIGIPYATFAMMMIASMIMAVFLFGVWSLSVAISRDKSGFHNLICHTRFLKGRAGAN